MVAEGLDPPRAVARRPRSSARRGDADRAPSTVGAEVLGEIRKAKTEAKKSLTTPVGSVESPTRPSGSPPSTASTHDVRAAGRVAIPLTLTPGDTFSVTVTLTDAP